MIQENLLLIAIAVFVLMFIGLILTIIEFKHGQPKRQVEEKNTERIPGALKLPGANDYPGPKLRWFWRVGVEIW